MYAARLNGHIHCMQCQGLDFCVFIAAGTVVKVDSCVRLYSRSNQSLLSSNNTSDPGGRRCAQLWLGAASVYIQSIH